MTNRKPAHDQLVTEGFPDGITKLRWRISHVPGTTPESVEQWKGLGGGLLVGWGPTRGAAATASRSARRTARSTTAGFRWAGIHGGDITVISPWLNLNSTITGKSCAACTTPRRRWPTPGRPSRAKRTLRMATAANKWFTAENDLGSIEPGNHGDLAVLDRDFFDQAGSRTRTSRASARSLRSSAGNQVLQPAFFGKQRGRRRRR